MRILFFLQQHATEVSAALYFLISLVIALKKAPSEEKYNIILSYIEAFFSRVSFLTYKDHKNSVKWPVARQPGYPDNEGE